MTEEHEKDFSIYWVKMRAPNGHYRKGLDLEAFVRDFGEEAGTCLQEYRHYSGNSSSTPEGRERFEAAIRRTQELLGVHPSVIIAAMKDAKIEDL